jgi:trigger factor
MRSVSIKKQASVHNLILKKEFVMIRRNKKAILAGILSAIMTIGLTGAAFASDEVAYEDENLELGLYEGLVYSAVLDEITDEDVQEYIDGLLELYSYPEKILEGKAAEGDTVNIDYKGTLDGVEFDGGSAEDASVTIGSGTYLEDFEKGLIGMTPGETKDVNVKFPEDYHSEDLAGKDAVFAITLNYICGEDVIPELNDDFVKENSDDAETVDEYVKNIREELEKNAESEFETQKENEILQAFDKIYKVVKVDEEKVKQDVQELVDTYKSYAEMYGMEYADFLAQAGFDEATFEEDVKEQAEAFEAQVLALKKVAELEKIEATDEAIDEYLAELAELYGYDSVDDLKAEFEDQGTDVYSDQMREQILLVLARKWLVDHASYEEAPAEEDANPDAENSDTAEADETDAEEVPAEETSAEETTAEEAPTEETTAEEATAK